MRKVIAFGTVVGSMLALFACSSSSSGGGGSSGSSSSGTSSSGTSSTGSTSPGGGDAASCPDPLGTLTTLLSAQGFDAGGVDAGAQTACINAMCTSELSDCDTESCQACAPALTQCALSCIAIPDASLPMFDASGGGTCDAPGPECAALSKCCSNIQLFASIIMNATLTSIATQCTTNAASCNESDCMQTITAVDNFNASACPPP